MGDDVPVRDVLCEAMEYLSKLGSNLRIRSENLKEKRVNKKKLINCHAVQKAANKVLRICDLSKKSLDNVEAGVKNVLSLIATSQSTANERKTSIDENTSKYKYFHHDSNKLRIPKKIPIKHYTSVRVSVEGMPGEMQEKYPVYHNCKLYRLRKRKKRILDTSTEIDNKESIEEDLNSKKPSDSEENIKKLKSKTHLRCIASESENSDSVDRISEKESNIVQNKDTEENYFAHNLEADSQQTDNESKKRKHTDMIADDNDAAQLPISKRKCIDSKEAEADVNLLDNHNENQDVSVGSNDDGANDDEVDEVNKEKDPGDRSKEDSISKQDDLSVVENGDLNNKEIEVQNCDEPVTTSKENKSENQTAMKDVLGNFENNDTVDEIIAKGKKKTENRISSDDSSVEIITENTVSVDSPGNNSGKENKDESISKSNENSNELVTINDKLDKKNKGEMEGEGVVKPLIKCVSISKLLKPDVLTKEAIPPNKFSPQKKDNSLQNTREKKDSTKKRCTEKQISSVKDKEDEKYWLEKRAEVKAFKSKPFDINTTRFTLSEKFLRKHSLKRITRGGSVIFEITDSPKRVAEENDGKKEMPHKDLEIAKDALLNDSDSDKSNKSGSVKNRAKADHNEIKSALLNDSSDESSNIQNTRSESPKSRRKRIRESIRERRLANFSSSDTEDDQLKKTVSKIKNHLLEGKSSSEDENDLIKKVNAFHKRRLINSSSDEDGNDKIPEKTNLNSPEPDDSTLEKENLKGEKEEDNRVDKMVRSKSKPNGASSSQNSDTQDVEDKEIDRLTVSITRKKDHRGRGSPGSEEAEEANLKKKTSILKSVSLTEDGNSDDAVSLTGSDPGEAEELPAITMPSMNGGDHSAAKEDLLEESDSSTSHHENKESEDFKKDETDDSETVKSKRRKGNTISSDSEAGSSRPKASAKDSDFDDSADESSDINKKKKKRKKKGSDSDGSANSSSNEGKKKRRRIKLLNDSDASGSDSENEGRNKHGRKNIRKVMGKDQLEEATKKAAREEKERIARIAERQKLYNNLLFDESGKPDEVVLDKVVLDFDPETKEPLIQVDTGLVAKLKPHQANGIKFMWDACFESVKRIKKDKGSGCILAHCMGLGKTLQVVSLTHTLLTHNSLTGVSRVLVVCPLSTVLNWVNEYRIWLKHAERDDEIDIYELSRYKQNSERAYQLQQWFEGGGICVLGYEMFRNLSSENNKKFKKKMLKNFQEALVDPGPDLVVCDEGHLLKNEKTSLSQSMNRVKTLRRIVLTGTPLQNNLKEYYCMVQFVKPNLLGKYNEYLNRFVNPITNGQYTDSTEHDIRVMKRRSHVLHKMLDGSVQRRDYGVLAPFLPPKHEYVLFITLSEVQVKLYQHYLDNYSRRPLAGKSSGFLFPDFQALQRIWTHPLVLKYNSERYEIMQQKKREREEEDSEGSLADFIDDDSSTPEESTSEESSDDLSDVSDDSRKKSKKKSLKKKGKKEESKDSKVSSRRGTRSNPVEIEEEEKNHSEVEEVKNENPTEWWIRMLEEEELEDMRNSHKLVLLFDILRQCETIGDKLLVFSQSLYSLDLIEHFLGKVDEATQEGRIDEKLGGHVGSWSPGIDYFRLDGSTSCENRSIWCKNFNREDNPRARLFLISTRAGGLGINLVAANRVVIFDVSWNPSHDVQSIFRVYRFGQKKPCYVYRFLAMGTMEEKIYERQVTKQAISKRVIDEQQIDRHYAENDLAELYKFEPQPPSPRPLPPLPKDRLFAEMLREHEKQIYKYHEHDSLLENKEEETLTEEERKAAWEDFENEKNRPPPAPFAANWPPVHNGMSVWAQQQQQMMFSAVTAMLRKDIPNINDNQIRDMLPHIFNTNPSMFGGYDYGLMQKMAEIYKYPPQAGMMNPAMMGAVMNPTGGAMSGSSGLQYEPPWQRQQQQQQQMRLQQLMTQQNSSGAKYYAGGLGSRDPIAMALQQQRARQIMGDRGVATGVGATGMGAGAVATATGASRPRGRPPLQPHQPPQPTAATGDIVDLDSD